MDATITPTSEYSAKRMMSSLGKAESFGAHVAAAVAAVPGIEAASSGSITVLAQPPQAKVLITKARALPPPAPAPKPVVHHSFGAMYLDRHGSDIPRVLPRDTQVVPVRCSAPCGLNTTAFLGLSCDVGGTGGVLAANGINGTASAPLTGDGVTFEFVTSARDLLPGAHYRVCVDNDGTGSQYGWEDTELEVYVSGVSGLSPTFIPNNETSSVEFEVICDAGCGSMSTGYLATSCQDVISCCILLDSML